MATRRAKQQTSLALAPDEPLEERIRALVEKRFEIACDEAADASLRIVGPRELERKGPEALQGHRMRSPVTPVLAIVPLDAPMSLVRECFRKGAADVIGYEELDEGLLPTIERAIADASASTTARTAAGLGGSEELAKSLRRRAGELERALRQLRQGYDETLAALVHALDVREHETASHSHRVAAYAVLLGLRNELGEEELETLYRGALLHDIGKIGIPDAVLLKPDSLSDDEWQVMRTHAEIGADLLRSIGFLRTASDVPQSHHEAWDGSGYPAGLCDREIPLHARIFAIVDSYDAIRSVRSYDPAHPHEQAIELLEADAGVRLDPDLVACFVAEPPSSWAALQAASAAKSPTFESALEACRALGHGLEGDPEGDPS